MQTADLNDYRYFAQVIEAGGFSAAARLLGIPKSRLSRRVAELEAGLGVRLIQRSTRKLTLTDAGQQVLVHSQALLREADAAARVAASLKQEPSGLVRISSPSVLVDSGLGRVFAAFLHAYPKVALETVLTSRRVDLIEEGVDVALRVRPSYDEDLQWPTLRLAQYGTCLVASPQLLAGYAPLRQPDDLLQLPALGAIEADRRIHWRMRGPGGVPTEIILPPRLASEHFGLRHRALIDGLGVSMMPEPLVRADLQAGRLVEVLPAWRFPVVSLQAVYASQRGLSPAVRALLDFLLAQLEADQSWEMLGHELP
ncbi:LysR substrate-binding domain-containing protein [Chitinimonas viridis]|uniref:LysR substrate-binding domain-containing protein n=1 Tax=Chitinimonas viridis TaxID=664880 RepID=A0ABT8B0J2_9NEIS|nr:LysR substrate-binding domain-containing protein [Chitinimonas viridis]MDN3575613.1 LysR substrate-binding domain-containing protein [Chitinimonas viridis]